MPVSRNAVPALRFRDALAMQVRVVYALILREMLSRFGERKLGYFWVLVEPLLQVAIFVGLRMMLGLENVRDVHVVPFLITGIVPFYYFRHVITKVMKGINANRGLLTFSQIKFIDLYYARFLLETGTYASIFIISMVLADIFIVDVTIKDPLYVILSFLMIGFCGFGIGLWCSAITALFDSFSTIVVFVLRLSYFLSGILFSLQTIPSEYHDLLSYSPIVHFIEIFRYHCLQGFWPLETFLDTEYVLFFSAIATVSGFFLIERLKRWLLR